MGDSTTVYYTLGGKLKRENVGRLVEALESNGFMSNDDDSEPSETNLDHTFYAHEVNYANTEEVDNLCIEFGLDYERWWDAGGGYAAGIERCRDGELKERAASEASPTFTLDEILDITEQLQGMANLIREARWWSEPLPEIEIVG